MAFLMLTVLMITTVLSGCSAAAPKTEAGTGSTVQEAVPAGETAQDAVPAEETAEDAATEEAAEQVSQTETAAADEIPQAPDVSDDYTLKKVVVLSPSFRGRILSEHRDAPHMVPVDRGYQPAFSAGRYSGDHDGPVFPQMAGK